MRKDKRKLPVGINIRQGILMASGKNNGLVNRFISFLWYDNASPRAARITVGKLQKLMLERSPKTLV